MSLLVPGFRIRQARVLRYRSSGEVAARLGWTPSKWSRLENSLDNSLDESVLQRISEELDFPLEFFAYHDADQLTEQDLLFRAGKSLLKREIEYLADFAAVASEIVRWVDSYHRLP